ncbi:MAG TPA: SDR family oxidoreductase [Pseudonocardiaceae bacterium]|nr:SDR family oxidoreductase [Pseudonocardiaceae bacterium]
MTHGENDYFHNAAVVVTGGASGIGRACARKFHSTGAQVFVFDKNKEGLAAAAVQMDSVIPVEGDISQWDDCVALADAVRRAGKPLRAIVNSAASFLAKGETATARDWDISLGVNVKGTALASSALLNEMRAAGGGAIVNVASISARIAQPNRWTYNAAKGAIVALTKCQALDLAGDNIRVNSVSPGTIWTPELARMTGDNRAEWGPILGSQHMLNRVGEPGEVAEVIWFLCGPGASFITGADILVDGGYVAMGHDRAAIPIPYSNE